MKWSYQYNVISGGKLSMEQIGKNGSKPPEKKLKD